MNTDGGARLRHRSRRQSRRLGTLLVTATLGLVGCTTQPAAGGRLDLPPLPALAAVDPATVYADARLEAMTTREKVASILMLHQAGTDPAALAAFVAANDLGGVILMGDNITADPAGVAALTATLHEDAGLPTLVAIDQEGGIVRRIRDDPGSSAATLRTLPATATRESFAARAGMLEALGVSVNFGIVADVTPDPTSFIAPRVLGVTAAESAERVAQAVAGEHGIVLSTLKHFPGHGVSPGDSHTGLPATGMGFDQWRAEHAPPFEAGIEAGAEFVMFGHLVFTAVDPLPATLSPTWHEVLRRDLGFEGVIITDDLAMLHASGDPRFADPTANAIAALTAGATMLLFVGGADAATVTDGVTAAVTDGRIPIETLDDAAHRLLEVRRGLSAQSGPYIHCSRECMGFVD